MRHKLVGYVITGAAVAAILFALVTLWTVVTTPPGKAPRLMGCSVLLVVTGSMEPEIPTGSIVFTREEEPDSLEVGDVIAFYSEDPQIQGEVNTHRIQELIEKDGKCAFVTKGDANPVADYYSVGEDQVLGKVVFHSRTLGVLAGFVGNKIGFLLVVLVPLFLIFLCNAREVIRLIRKEMQMIEAEEKERIDGQRETEAEHAEETGENSGEDRSEKREK